MITYNNLCDTAGRFIAGLKDFVPKRFFMESSLVRGIIFAIIFTLINGKFAAQVLNSDWFLIIAIGLFAATSGYWTTVAMKFGSDETTKDQGLAGTIMGFHLTLGITVGSVIAEVFFS